VAIGVTVVLLCLGVECFIGSFWFWSCPCHPELLQRSWYSVGRGGDDCIGDVKLMVSFVFCKFSAVADVCCVT